MNLTPYFETLDFASIAQPQLGRLEVNDMRWRAIGGCSEATITAYGGQLDVWEAADMLRRPVIIRDEIGRAVWWGYVAEVQIRDRTLEISASLAEVYNRVAVIYSYVEPGTNKVGTRKMTSWTEDADSIAYFGYKEMLLSTDGASAAEAENMRDVFIAQRRYPLAGMMEFTRRSRNSAAENNWSATLICRGWWDTLDWRYASVDATASIAYLDSSTDQRIGYNTADQMLMQQFTVGTSGIRALSIKLYVKKTGTPSDNFTVGIYEVDSNGNPTGSALASATLAGGSITTSLVWYTFSFTAVELQANTMYAIRISRSGANDTSNYFHVGVNTALGYTGGVFKIYNAGTSTWGARSPDADMNFAIMVDDLVDTARQIRDLITINGQFISAVDIEATSGVTRGSYQDGTMRAKAVIEKLMQAGGANDRRLISKVDVNRRAWVWEEPPMSEVDYHMTRDGRLEYANGAAVTEYLPPVGIWIRMKDLIPKTVDQSRLISPEVQFAEGAMWSAADGLRFEWRGMPSVEELMELRK